MHAPEVPPKVGVAASGTENEIKTVAVVAAPDVGAFVTTKLNFNGFPNCWTGPGVVEGEAVTLTSTEAAPAVTLSVSPPEMVCVEPPPRPCTLKAYDPAAVAEVVVTTNVTVIGDAPLKAITFDG